MISIPASPSALIWDACCLLNLMALPDPADVLSAFRCVSYIAKEVREGEVLHLRPLPEDNSPPGTLEPVDLAPLFANNSLQEVTLGTSEEVDTFVALAAAMDDGEARSATIAYHRNLWLVTDDRVAIRVASELPSPIPILTTPDWLRIWADNKGASSADVAEAIRQIELRARYSPRTVAPLYQWWNSHKESYSVNTKISGLSL